MKNWGNDGHDSNNIKKVSNYKKINLNALI